MYISKKLKNIYQNIFNNWVFFTIICIFYLLILHFSSIYIFTNQFYFANFSDQFTRQSIETLLGVQAKYWWVDYVFTPLVIFLKISFATICISIGSVLSNFSFKFKMIFKAVLLAEVVFLVAQIVYFINIFFHLDTLTLQTISNYYPLTVLSYVGTENVVDWLEYPLQTINLFELFYMMAIAWLLSKQWKEDFMESLAMVVPSYGTGLILWLVFVTFITLQIS